MIQAIDLTKVFGDYMALKNLNLTIDKGEVFCLLGQNGAGKTTTINIFLGFIGPSSGKALINGQEVKHGHSTTNRYTAYIPEVVMLYGNLTAVENIDFFTRIAGFSYPKKELEAFLTISCLQSSAFYNRVASFSKGMRQKVGIAIAVAKKAEAIFMDEPTSGLDPKATNEFTDIVTNLGREGKSVFMATHDIFNAVNISTRIGIMQRGVLVHVVETKDINAIDLQKLYLETI